MSKHEWEGSASVHGVLVVSAAGRRAVPHSGRGSQPGQVEGAQELLRTIPVLRDTVRHQREVPSEYATCNITVYHCASNLHGV